MITHNPRYPWGIHTYLVAKVRLSRAALTSVLSSVGQQLRPG